MPPVLGSLTALDFAQKSREEGAEEEERSESSNLGHSLAPIQKELTAHLLCRSTVVDVGNRIAPFAILGAYSVLGRLDFDQLILQ